MTAPPPRDPQLSPRQRRLFTAAMALLPVLFFLLLEGGLRLFGYGDDYPLFVEAPGDEGYRYQSRTVGKRYFAGQARPPSSLVDYFKATKDGDTFRIFVQGGSSALGYPFYYGGSFSRMLEQRLLQTFPGTNVEVVNTAMSAVNSYTLLDFVDEIIAQEPDVVLIYAGHNEYYGALGVGSAESLGQVRGVVNFYLKVQKLRTMQLLRSLLAKGAGLFADRAEDGRPGATLMERMVGEQTIPYGSPGYARGLAQFRGNLGDLLARYEAAGIPVLIGTVASNERDQPPFISTLADGTDEAAWQAEVAKARRALAAADTAGALEALDAAIRLDSLSAETFYAQARLLDALGRPAEARAAYLTAKDRDALRFRAPEAINQIIREEAARHGATVVETNAALAAASPDGIIGKNVMLEHLHPNVEGYFRLADAFYEALRAQEVIGPWTRYVPAARARAELLLTPVDSLAGMLRVQQLMGSWPFQPPGVFVDFLDTLTARTPIQEIAYAHYKGDLSWPEATQALLAHYEKQRDFHNALRAALALIQQYPHRDGPYLAAGNVLMRQGRYDEAYEYFLAADEREATAKSQVMLGSIKLQRGQQEEAIAHLERALTLDPQNQQALYNLGGAYALAKQYGKARAAVERLLQLAPNRADARRLLASLPPA